MADAKLTQDALKLQEKIDIRITDDEDPDAVKPQLNSGRIQQMEQIV